MIVQDPPIAVTPRSSDSVESPRPAPPVASSWRTLVELAKLRISALALLTTAIGYWIASSGEVSVGHFVLVLLGTALCATGANSANQILEIEHDRQMDRTRGRPLPTGRLQTRTAILFALGTTFAGVGLLSLIAPIAAAMGIFTVITYAFVYTPLKRVTPWCTVVGAIPGAMPPVIGATAAHGSIDATSLWLFAILFFWQLPHFYAIAWLYRDDYGRGQFPMLAVVDRNGARTARQSILFTIAMILATLGPTWSGLATGVYAPIALVLGLGFLAYVIRFATLRTETMARKVFFVSILYLPLVLAAWVAFRA